MISYKSIFSSLIVERIQVAAHVELYLLNVTVRKKMICMEKCWGFQDGDWLENGAS